MTRVCPKCGAENGVASVHCRNCSVKLPEPTTGMMGPPPSLRRKSLLRKAFWVFILLAIGAAGFWARENMAWRDVRSGAGGCYESWQNVQTAVSGVMHRWFSKWLPGLEVEPAPTPMPAVTSAPVPAPVPENVVKIRCRRCGGMGFTALTEQRTVVDLTKRKHTVTETKRVPCRLCDQHGGRTIILPSGAEICPACYGMGRIVGVLNNRESILQCNICLGKGYVFRKY